MWLDAKPDASPPGGSRGASGVVSPVQETAHVWPAAAMDAASSSAAQPHAPAAMQTAPALSSASGSSPQPLPQAAAATSKDAAAAAAPAHHGADTEMAEMQPPAGRSVARGKGGKGAPAGLAPVPGSAADLPKFYMPAKLPEALAEAQAKEQKALQELFAGTPAVGKKDFHAFAVAACGFPSFFAPSLFDKIAAEVAGKDATPPETLERAACEAWYAANCKDCRPEKRLLNLLRAPGANHVTRADWKRHLTALLDTHAGLDFLKGTAEFQERYLECVIERIYYVNDRADSVRLSTLLNPKPPALQPRHRNLPLAQAPAACMSAEHARTAVEAHSGGPCAVESGAGAALRGPGAGHQQGDGLLLVRALLRALLQVLGARYRPRLPA